MDSPEEQILQEENNKQKGEKKRKRLANVRLYVNAKKTQKHTT